MINTFIALSMCVAFVLHRRIRHRCRAHVEHAVLCYCGATPRIQSQICAHSHQLLSTHSLKPRRERRCLLAVKQMAPFRREAVPQSVSPGGTNENEVMVACGHVECRRRAEIDKHYLPCRGVDVARAAVDDICAERVHVATHANCGLWFRKRKWRQLGLVGGVSLEWSLVVVGQPLRDYMER